MDFSAFLAMLENLKAKANEFLQSVGILQNIENNTVLVPELEAQRQSLLSVAGGIKTTIDTISGSIDATINWVKSMLGLSTQPDTIGNLELFPLLGIAVVAAAVAAITKWLVDYNAFMQRYQVYQQMLSNGVPPTEAWQTAQQAGKQTMLSDAASIVKGLLPLMLIGGAFYFGPKLLKRLGYNV